MIPLFPHFLQPNKYHSILILGIWLLWLSHVSGIIYSICLSWLAYFMWHNLLKVYANCGVQNSFIFEAE